MRIITLCGLLLGSLLAAGCSSSPPSSAKERPLPPGRLPSQQTGRTAPPTS